MTQPLPTQNPFGGGELLVTRLENPATHLAIEGRFTLGWLGRLTPEQLDFVGLLLRNRNNLQKLATDLGVAYNTARSRLDEVVAAVGGVPGELSDEAEDAAEVAEDRAARRRRALDRLAAGDATVDDVLTDLR